MTIAEDENNRTIPALVPVITHLYLTLLFSEGHLAKPGTFNVMLFRLSGYYRTENLAHQNSYQLPSTQQIYCVI